MNLLTLPLNTNKAKIAENGMWTYVLSVNLVTDAINPPLVFCDLLFCIK